MIEKMHFGTDGIRGTVHKDIHPEEVLLLGSALGYYFRTLLKGECKIIIGQDTRSSGDMIRAALVSGLLSYGIKVDYVGIVPTSSIPFLIRKQNASAGIMVSASHNAAIDNGIKIFDKSGHKLADEVERSIEELMNNPTLLRENRVLGDQLGRCSNSEDNYLIYRNFLAACFKGNLDNLNIIIDAANGSASKIAEELFAELGGNVTFMNSCPNGSNINLNCGSTNIKGLQKHILESKASLGLAFDGDADRLVAIDEKGNVINGDKLLTILALHLKEKRLLKNNKIVATSLSSLTFEDYLNTNGIGLIRSEVGDKHVFDSILKHDLSLGGEQSGHIIFSDYNTTGDGILTALQLLTVMVDRGESLHNLAKDIPESFQIFMNVKLSNEFNKRYFVTNERINEFIDRMKAKLRERERIIVRPSGTENIIRIMTEGEDKKRAFDIAYMLSNFIDKEVNFLR